MPRYFFNVRAEHGTNFIEDLEGSELADLETAHREAIEDARSLMSQAMLDGRDISRRVIEVRDEAGNLVLRVPFSEATRDAE